MPGGIYWRGMALAMPRCFSVLAICTVALCGQELPRGQVLDKVLCGSGPLSYALYLPSQFSDGRLWPILYCLDPAARGRVAVERFAGAAEAEGFVVAGSNDSRNGPVEPARQAIQAMVEDTTARIRIDRARVYVTGFSGGARLALGWARGGGIAGAAVCGAAFGPSGAPEKVPFAVYLAAGRDDFNYFEMHSASLDLARSGANQRWVEFEGGHQWLSEALALDALRFFSGKESPRSASDSAQVRKEAGDFERTFEQFMASSGRRRESLDRNLKLRAGAESDSPDRRLARRVLAAAAVTARERPPAQLKGK